MKNSTGSDGDSGNSSRKWRNLAITGFVVFLFFLIKGMIEHPYRP